MREMLKLFVVVTLFGAISGGILAGCGPEPKSASSTSKSSLSKVLPFCRSCRDAPMIP